jgi:excisionase family DNA binding protein
MITRLLSPKEVAALLGVSEVWVYQHANGTRRPTLPSVKLGRAVRFRVSDIEQFLGEQLRAA